jgi:hypothetical protein
MDKQGPLYWVLLPFAIEGWGSKTREHQHLPIQGADGDSVSRTLNRGQAACRCEPTHTDDPFTTGTSEEGESLDHQRQVVVSTSHSIIQCC